MKVRLPSMISEYLSKLIVWAGVVLCAPEIAGAGTRASVAPASSTLPRRCNQVLTARETGRDGKRPRMLGCSIPKARDFHADHLFRRGDVCRRQPVDARSSLDRGDEASCDGG